MRRDRRASFGDRPLRDQRHVRQRRYGPRTLGFGGDAVVQQHQRDRFRRDPCEQPEHVPGRRRYAVDGEREGGGHAGGIIGVVAGLFYQDLDPLRVVVEADQRLPRIGAGVVQRERQAAQFAGKAACASLIVAIGDALQQGDRIVLRHLGHGQCPRLPGPAGMAGGDQHAGAALRQQSGQGGGVRGVVVDQQEWRRATGDGFQRGRGGLLPGRVGGQARVQGVCQRGQAVQGARPVGGGDPPHAVIGIAMPRNIGAGQRGLADAAEAMHGGLGQGGGGVLGGQCGVQLGQQVVASGEQTVLQRHGAAEDAWCRACGRCLALGHRQDDAAAFLGIVHAEQIAEGLAMKQARWCFGVAAQQTDATLAVTGCLRDEEIGEFLLGPEAGRIIPGI